MSGLLLPALIPSRVQQRNSSLARAVAAGTGGLLLSLLQPASAQNSGIPAIAIPGWQAVVAQSRFEEASRVFEKLRGGTPGTLLAITIDGHGPALAPPFDDQHALKVGSAGERVTFDLDLTAIVREQMTSSGFSPDQVPRRVSMSLNVNRRDAPLRDNKNDQRAKFMSLIEQAARSPDPALFDAQGYAHVDREFWVASIEKYHRPNGDAFYFWVSPSGDWNSTIRLATLVNARFQAEYKKFDPSLFALIDRAVITAAQIIIN